MTLKTSFARVLRALRSKRNISQRDFADTTSRTYLSKLELGKSSITLDKFRQVSQRLDLSPLTLLTLTLSQDTGLTVSDLMSKLHEELADLQRGGGLPSLNTMLAQSTATAAARCSSVVAKRRSAQHSAQAEMTFGD